MLKRFIDLAQSLTARMPRAAEPAVVISGQYRDLGAMLQATRDLPPARYIAISGADFNPREGIEIGMNCAGITDARSPTPILGTYGLVTCLGVAIYNRATQTGGLAHLAQGDNDPLHLAHDSKEALTRLLQAVRTDQSQTLEVRLTAGPFDDRYPFSTEVLGVLNATPNLQILSSDTGGKRGVKAFGLDTRRWDEGLIKGANSCHLPLEEITACAANMELFREGIRHAVDITAIPPGRVYLDGLFDARSSIPPPPTSSRPALGRLIPR